LASKGDKRAFVNISLVDDTGINELVLSLSKLVLNDPNLSMSKFQTISVESLAWSDEKALLRIATIGLSSAIQVKSKLVILVAMNSSVIEKFTECFNGSEYALESVSNAEGCEEYLSTLPSDALPLAGILTPPTASETQQAKLKTLAAAHHVEFVVSIPKNAMVALTNAISLNK